MRTLKKSLCLVLALIFVLGLCTIGSNAAYADYTDLEEVTDEYLDAVEVLTGLRVINGYTDDTFGPKKDVTRAEAAAMITRMMLGREDADKLPIGDVKFSDVPETNWAAKYIAFCANRGIIVGMGDGTFHPSENVTGTQMATMLLRALGYGVMGEYEGKGWDINAVADALYYGVFKDSKVVDFSNAATREETALYVWNTMWIQLVGYDVDLNYYIGRTYRDAFVRHNEDKVSNEPLTFAYEAYDLVKLEGYVVVANQKTGSEYTVIGWMNDDGTVEDLLYLNYESDLDIFGHDVNAYFCADEKEDKVNHIDYYDGYLLQDESVPFDKGSKLDDFYRAAKAANKSNLNVKFEDVPTWTNYDYSQLGIVADKKDADGKWCIKDADDNYPYYTVEEVKGQKSSSDSAPSGTWILDRSGEIMLVLKTEYRVAKVKEVDTDHEEVELDVYNGGTLYPEIYDLSWKDIKLVYDDIAKDDYVQVQPVGDLFYVNPTTTKTVDISEINTAFYTFNNFAFWMDRYGYGIPIVDSDALFDPVTYQLNVGVGDKVMFYVIEGISAFGTDNYFGLQILEKAKTEGVIYVVKVGEYLAHSEWDIHDSDLTTAYKVQGINQDGEEVVYTISKKDVEDGKVILPKEDSVVEVRKQGKTYFFDKNVKNLAVLHNDGTKSSYLRTASDIYLVTDDTTAIYWTGSGKDLKITVASTLAKDVYDVYAITKKSGGTYKLETVWVKDVTAPKDYSKDTIIYVGGLGYFGMVKTNTPVGSDFDDNGDAAQYYHLYKDGVLTKFHVTGESDIYATGYVAPGTLKDGFYVYTETTDGSGKVELKAFTPTATAGVHYDVILKNGSLKSGRFNAEGSNGIPLKVTVYDVSFGVTTDTKKDAEIISLDRLEELLSEGYTMTVDYMYALNADGDEVPTGVMYITSVTPPTVRTP